MRKGFLFLIAALLLPVFAQAQIDSNSIRLQDEGTTQGQVKILNCVGTGIACTRSGATGTLTVAGGGGGGGNFAAVTVDFGSSGADSVLTTVTGQAWVTSSSVIVCVPTMMATADRGDGEEDALIEGLRVAVSNRVASTGFDVTVMTDGDIGNPFNSIPISVTTGINNMHRVGKFSETADLAFGQFLIHCTGG